ncbi:phospholipid/cholesterol/gamma-HCH transport system ATP-binding protein [Stella humosa]|uniref:Phospholipid/cholesterol/gamma-HCH transport system ATP-binding protein n=1 Tax=Stella humosa TaxID=94 RepID=A0A3N1KX85_9PROT|nr:ATP-binding cassette domain-containing protein [Stella humosa]ROP83837.1 phospholipid/cholesterol/gamma-HCH transport system ATP-binding protein [Stella humosa]BBK32902.1 ABC transporter ATP-binding protein [Stella humosa]
MAEDPIITVEHMRTGFGRAVLFEDLSFTVARGEVFVILGGSGCGKSTLLKHLIGLYAPWQGRIDIGGRDLVGAGEDERLAILRMIGVMYQQGALFGSMNLIQNVRLPLEEFTRLPEDALNAVALAKLKLVGLDRFAFHMPSEISGGMRKRAAIARAMALDPEILFLDEPSAGLDPITSAELDELILQLRRSLGITFVVVTHELASIFAIADRVIMLDKEAKGIIAEGPPAQLRDESTHPFVRRFFHRQTAEAQAVADAEAAGKAETPPATAPAA